MRKIDKEMPFASQKLLELIDSQADGRVQKFAKMIGESQQKINRIFLKDKRNGKYPRISDDLKELIIGHFSLPQDYFLESFEPMMSQLPSDLDGEPIKSYNPRVGVPYYNVDFEMGYDFLTNDQTTNCDYMINFSPYNKCDAWCNARGNSMHPTISSGDIIALKRIEDAHLLISGEIYAIVTVNELRTIKRIKDNGKTLTLIPDNKEYPEQTIDKSDVIKVFQVMGSMKMF